MKKALLCFVLSLIFLSVQAQTPCDSIFISPQSVYLNQLNDSAAFIELSYTGHHDLSYAWIDFIFPDSTNIVVREVGNTSGISGPFTYKDPDGYKVIFKNPSIPPNTKVNAFMRLYHYIGGNLLSCPKPVTFILNSTTGIQGNQTNIKFNIFPNPAKDFLYFEGGDRGLEVSIYDLAGRNLLRQNVIGFNSMINIQKFSAGVYFVKVKGLFGTSIRKLIKVI